MEKPVFLFPLNIARPIAIVFLQDSQHLVADLIVGGHRMSYIRYYTTLLFGIIDDFI